MPENISDHNQCIDELISNKENYPYYYWLAWIFFLMSLTAVLSFNLFHDMTLSESGLSNSLSHKVQHTANHKGLLKTEISGPKIFLSTERRGLPPINNHS